jgi:type II restriction enzyme
MKYHALFNQYLECKNSDEVFNYLHKSLIDTITTYDYFVDWEKIYRNVNDLEMDLNLLNFLIGKSDIKERLSNLLRRYPNVIKTIPILLAVRSHSFEILEETTEDSHAVKNYNFSATINLSDTEIDKIVNFMGKSGLIDLLKNNLNASIVDYVLGVEVGLDTNARKNRHGTEMERLVGKVLQNISTNNNYKYMEQATAKRLLAEWNYRITVDKNRRRFDFAVLTKKSLYLIETNYYSGGGSKLKATAGEYKTIFDLLHPQNIKFVWITDGHGWESAINSLRETFDYIDYTLNLKMINCGLLKNIIELDL